MRGISIEKEIVVYYGNVAGYVSGGKAVVDPIFASQEMKEFLAGQKGISDAEWREGVFERLSKGQKGLEAVTMLKNCRIWQLKPETDIMMRFIGYEELQMQFGDSDPQNYQMVYDGEVESNDLETIYTIFNMNHPPGYAGHSLSMSDVVELYDESSSIYFYCDRGGFESIEFEEPGQGMSIKSNSEDERRESGKMPRRPLRIVWQSGESG